MAVKTPPHPSPKRYLMSLRVLAFQLALLALTLLGPASITGWKW
jgi:hypothetical protein